MKGTPTYLEQLKTHPEQYRLEGHEKSDRRAALISKALRVISDTVEMHYPHVAIAMSWGKDSVTLLALYRQGYPELPISLLFTDTGRKFSETYEYMGVVQAFFAPTNLFVHSPDASLKTCDECRAWKVQAAVEGPKKYGFEALLVGTRADEHEARNDGKYVRYVGETRRAHPILDWTEADVWEYLRTNDIPTHPLYEQGYRSLGCADPCTVRTPFGEGERGGRAPDKEAQMDLLRGEGYW